MVSNTIIIIQIVVVALVVIARVAININALFLVLNSMLLFFFSLSFDCVFLKLGCIFHSYKRPESADSKTRMHCLQRKNYQIIHLVVQQKRKLKRVYIKKKIGLIYCYGSVKFTMFYYEVFFFFVTQREVNLFKSLSLSILSNLSEIVQSKLFLVIYCLIFFYGVKK